MTLCNLCDKLLEKDADNPDAPICSNPKLHEGKAKIAKLLIELKTSIPDDKPGLISRIQKLEDSYQIPQNECYDFTHGQAKEKLGLTE